MASSSRPRPDRARSPSTAPKGIAPTRALADVITTPREKPEDVSKSVRRQVRLATGEAQIPCAVTTAEDILLAKLRWYSDGGEVSDRQWNDIVGLIATNPDLDVAYLDLWASRLGVTALLARARAAA